MRLPAVRFAPRDDLAALARVAPLLRVARDLEEWLARRGGPGHQALTAADTAKAATALDLAPREITAAWRAALAIRGAGVAPTGMAGVLATGTTSDAVLHAWEVALAAFLDAEELDGIATALFTAGGAARWVAPVFAPPPPPAPTPPAPLHTPPP